MKIGRRTRRVLLRASVSSAVAALSARLVGRGRRGVVAAATTGAVAGAAQEWPPAIALTPLLVATSRGDVAAGAAGGAIAVATRRVWPVAPRHGADLRPRRHPDAEHRPAPDGAGVLIAVNPASGSPLQPPPTEELRGALPGATVVELHDGADLAAVLRSSISEGTVAIGAAGGDGTLNTAAAVALEQQLPLVAVPAGTLNHLARDLGLETVDDVVTAVRAGTVIRMDVGQVTSDAGAVPFLNTASFGGYTEMVDAREQLESRIGKWPALAVALVRVLRQVQPLHVVIDGVSRDVWLVFIGNCRYAPDGFGPSWREQLDDGLLDVRLVDARHPFARTRLVFAVLSGTLSRCAPYEEWTCDRLEVESVDGPLRLALDGETGDAGDHLVFDKRACGLTVHVPPA